MGTTRKTRSDKKIGTIEKELGIALRDADGRKIQKDKTLGDVRKQEADERSPDQKLAAKIKIKIPPKVKASEVKKIRQIVKKLSAK